MALLRKLLAGSGLRKSRLHDEKGHLIDLGGLAYSPHAMATTLLRLTLGYRPAMPWLGYRAIRRLDTIIGPRWRILEFGSGMSTIWFSSRCRHIVSIESDPHWHRKMERELARRTIDNVDYRYKARSEYHRLDELPDNYFDFVLIDGPKRGKCALTALQKLATHGYIYLDNSDKHSSGNRGDTRIAEDAILQAVKDRGGSVEYFVDLVPTHLMVTEGMLVQFA